MGDGRFCGKEESSIFDIGGGERDKDGAEEISTTTFGFSVLDNLSFEFDTGYRVDWTG